MTEDLASRQPLEGYRVLDLGQIYNGSYAGMLLAFGGADVIKVEPPRGDRLRGRTTVKGGGAAFAMLNSNKRGITLDLSQERGREILLRLVRTADVLLENFRPGTMERLGVGPEVLRAERPSLIYASSTGFGNYGPYRDYAAMDLTVQAFSGLMSVTGFAESEPVKAGSAVADFAAGIHLYAAIVTALLRRERTGLGSDVDTSMLEAVYPTLASSLSVLFGGARTNASLRSGNRHASLAEVPYNSYQTADGHIAIVCVTDRHWEDLAAVAGLSELAERFPTRSQRVEHIEEIDRSIGEWTSQLTKDAVFSALRERAVPCAPVRELDEVVHDPHLTARGMLQEIDHPELGPVVVPHSPLHFEGIDRVPIRPSPALGQHNREILCDTLGLSDEDFESLTQDGVV